MIMALFVPGAHTQPSIGARCLIFGRTILLFPYVMCANSKGSGETAQMHRLARAFAGHLCDKYHNLGSVAFWKCKKFTNISQMQIILFYQMASSRWSAL